MHIQIDGDTFHLFSENKAQLTFLCFCLGNSTINWLIPDLTLTALEIWGLFSFFRDPLLILFWAFGFYFVKNWISIFCCLLLKPRGMVFGALLWILYFFINIIWIKSSCFCKILSFQTRNWKCKWQLLGHKPNDLLIFTNPDGIV